MLSGNRLDRTHPTRRPPESTACPLALDVVISCGARRSVARVRTACGYRRAHRGGACAASVRSFADFTDRARPSLPELESLILAGALDALGRTRPSLLLEARAGARAWAGVPDATPALVRVDGEAFLPDPEAPVSVPDLPEFGAHERVRGESTSSGLWFSGHPLDALPAEIERSATRAADVERRVGRSVSVVGMPCAYRRVQTKTGAHMLFLTLADRTGLVECVLFPDVYAREAAALRAGAVRVRGRVSETLGAISVDVERVEVLAGVSSLGSEHSTMIELDADE